MVPEFGTVMVLPDTTEAGLPVIASVNCAPEAVLSPGTEIIANKVNEIQLLLIRPAKYDFVRRFRMLKA